MCSDCTIVAVVKWCILLDSHCVQGMLLDGLSTVHGLSVVCFSCTCHLTACMAILWACMYMGMHARTDQHGCPCVQTISHNTHYILSTAETDPVWSMSCR